MAANRWGLIPDVPNGKDWDIRDHVQMAVGIPAIGTNRINYMKDQRQHGACTGFAIERIVRMALQHSQFPDVDLSPLFAYYNNRLKSGLPVTQDTGATIRASIDAARDFGICRESWWTYANADGYLFVKPENYAYSDALDHQVLEAYSVPNNLDLIRQALASGFGVTYGTTVHYNSFEYAANGDVTMPQINDSVAGAHNIVLDGWDDTKSRFSFGNSWSDKWGNKGFGTIPYDHVVKFGFDFWVVKMVESPSPQPTNHIANIEYTDGSSVKLNNVRVITVDNKQVWP